MPADWTQPPLAETPADLGPILLDARLIAIEDDPSARELRLRFALPPDAGPAEATFVVEGATHRLLFAYRAPAASLAAEDALAHVADWARTGLVTSLEAERLPEGLIVARAHLHVLEEAATLIVEGPGEDPDALVWWDLRVSGRTVAAHEGRGGVLIGEPEG